MKENYNKKNNFLIGHIQNNLCVALEMNYSMC